MAAGAPGGPAQDAQGATVESLAAEVAVLRRQVHALRQQAVRFDHWHNTLHSAWYRRAWWWLQGYRLHALGTWYRAPWNASARKYED